MQSPVARRQLLSTYTQHSHRLLARTRLCTYTPAVIAQSARSLHTHLRNEARHCSHGQLHDHGHLHHHHFHHQPHSPPPPSAMAPSSSPAPAAVAAAAASFYMRELPKDKLIGYDTPEGKELFKAALLEGGLEAFFPLSQQFLTQDEPAFCGLGTLCMILNALKIDPAATWRKPWRWFTQEMLDCCRPLDWVKQHGITLAEFTCLAKCNGLDAKTKYADQTSFEEFVQAVKDCTQSTDQLMAVSYSRASLGQTGSGHFSPAGGYTSKNGGMVLILDVARFKYPSYWVPIRALYEALIPYDPTSNQPRGYSILRRPSVSKPAPALLMLNATTPTWPTMYQPLADVVAAANSYTSLISSLVEILQSPTGLPTVTSRFEGSHMGTLSALTKSPSFNAEEGMKAHSEYRQRVGALHKYFAGHSDLYRQLETADDLWRTEITVFMLALLSAKDVGERMNAGVRKEVEQRLKADLADATIKAEVDMVRRQMESLTDCAVEDGSCSRPQGNCCGMNTCG